MVENPSHQPLVGFERALAAVMRLWTGRETLADIARRSGYDLPPTSWALLEHLDARGALRVSDIAACHGVDVSSITPRLKALEKAGLITREKLSTDARVFIISISSSGVRALQSVHAARRAILAHVTAEADGPEIAIASRLLTRVADRLAAESDRSAPGTSHR